MANSAAGVIGSLILSAVGIGVGLATVWADWPLWTSVGVIAAGLVGAVLCLWAARHDPSGQRPETAFIRGDLTNSSLDTVSSEADVFVDGSVTDTRMNRVFQRRERPSTKGPRRRKE